jgi:hypothetical protein
MVFSPPGNLILSYYIIGGLMNMRQMIYILLLMTFMQENIAK